MSALPATPPVNELPAWVSDRAEEIGLTSARIVLILVVALLTRYLLHRAINRFTARTARGDTPVILRPLGTRARNSLRDSVIPTERRSQRAAAMGSVLRSFTSILILAIAVVLILGELGINLTPIVASAGVVGVALGFGAQNLVKDFLSGIGLILEDQYGVGDVVDLGEASGTIEGVGLRTTRLRDNAGVVWYVRNGEIVRVGNKSQGYAQVVLDVPVAHDSDLDLARRAMQEAGDALVHEEDWADKVLGEAESLGVEQITSTAIILRLQVRTTTADRWRVARELRLRVAQRFAELDIASPLPVMGLGMGDSGRTESGTTT
ncbi:MAG: mechanosensitive ion channel family protein [Geodermatophilaceae bacterium]|nr:mechanosensitive ion channel family protein [Geodermatophilaceae bacterium]